MKRILNLLLVAVLLASLVVPLLPQQRALAYPSLPGSTDNVTVSPYATAQAGAGNWGANNRYYVTIGQKYRMRQNGTITDIRLYSANITTTSLFRVSIWRKDGATYDQVGQSENLAPQLVSGQFLDLTLTSPIAGVQEGDYYGYSLDGGGSSEFSAISLGTGAVTRYVTIADPDTQDTTDYDWDAQTSNANGVVIEFKMQAPQAVFIGDSIIAGHPAHYSFVETTATTNISSMIAYQYGNITAYSYQNMGIGSQTTTQIAARFTADVINLKPQIAVIEGGVNDIALSQSLATFITNWTTMLDAAEADSNIKLVLALTILPWTDGTNGQMQTRDIWNDALETLADNYSKVKVVDASAYVGQFRVGGDVGNLWDIQPAYDVDGVHFNQDGHTQIAQALADMTASVGLKTLPTSNVSMDKDGAVTGNYSANFTYLGAATADGWFECGLTNSYGNVTSNETYNSVGVKYASLNAALTPGQTYHYRIRATNTDGTSNGSDETVTLTMPTVTTGTYNKFLGNSATLNGNVTNMGVASDTYVSFEWGYTAAYGTTTTESTQAAIGSFTKNITYDPLRTVHYRSVSRVGAVYSYGSDQEIPIDNNVDTSVMFIVPLGLLLIVVFAAQSEVISDISPIGVIILILVVGATIGMVSSVFVNLF